MEENAVPRIEYPRPQFRRDEWLNLNGEWTCEFDFSGSGRERGLTDSRGFSRKILVPFCPESRLSGIGFTDFIPHLFYQRFLFIPESWRGKKILLRFGAVDYQCEGFIDGKSTGSHAGGSTSFVFDITSLVRPGGTHSLVLAVDDNTRSGVQPLGKQSIGLRSAGCFYTRTTGIWQTVWMEALDPDALSSCKIIPDPAGKAFHFTPLFLRERFGRKLRISLHENGKTIAEKTAPGVSGISVPLDLAENNVRLWSPEDPFLYDVSYEVLDPSGKVLDRVESYAGLRETHIEGDRIFLNGKPVFLRFVLDQGFYPDGLWTAPSDKALKHDIELALAAGFNGARLHQKVFEERFHYWADKLGYLTWGEFPSYGLGCFYNAATFPLPEEFHESARNFLAEWKDTVARDFNHPSIIAWCPANETCPAGNLQAYRALMREIYRETKRLDPARPCNDASGYRHVQTDLWTVHLYCPDAGDLKKNLHPDGTPVFQKKEETGYCGQPYLNDEFGGFLYRGSRKEDSSGGAWGYYGSEAADENEFCARIAAQVKTMMDDPAVSGFCYTQLTDVEQEQNGVYFYDRAEKVPPEKLSAAFHPSEVPAILKRK